MRERVARVARSEVFVPRAVVVLWVLIFEELD